jgi:phage recombination protein Bet
MSAELIQSKIKDLGYAETIFRAMKNSLYPGAKDESVLMVMETCRAAEIDPLLKAYHIVPMYLEDKTLPKEGNYYPKRYVDVIMPSIDLHRIKAARSGVHLGTSEPEYGPLIVKRLGTMDIEFPEWCIVKVKKLVAGHIVEFTAKEFWIENYASKKNDDPTPNAMWRKRLHGQLAKCTEAQALRKAFPELCAALTAEEMDGKTLDLDEIGGEYSVVTDKGDTKLKEIINKKKEAVQASQPKILEQKQDDPIFQNLVNNINATGNHKDLLAFMKDINQLKPEYKAEATKLFNERQAQLKQKKADTELKNDQFIQDLGAVE